MAVQTVKRITCDRKNCGQEIIEGSVYVDAMVYGVTFHQNCWDSMTAYQAVRALGLDEIKWRLVGDDESDGGKVCYTEIPAFSKAAP